VYEDGVKGEESCSYLVQPSTPVYNVMMGILDISTAIHRAAPLAGLPHAHKPQFGRLPFNSLRIGSR